MSVPVNLEEALRIESAFYGIPVEVYSEYSTKERSAAKARHSKFAKQVSKATGRDANVLVSLTREELDTLFRDSKENGRHEDGQEIDGPDDDMDDGESLEERAASVKVTTPPDYVGEESGKRPRSLEDVYAYWPIGDGEHYVTVERKQPKSYNGVPCAGYLGMVRKRLSVRAFQEMFGGREYELCVYGPDPGGRQDEITGEPVIKRLSKPIKVTVPLLPPNLSAIPSVMDHGQGEDEMSYHPFAGIHSPEAKVVEASAKSQREMFELGARIGGANRQVQDPTAYIGFAKETFAQSSEALRKQMELTEQRHQDEIRRRDEDVKRRDEEMRDLRDELRRITGRSEGSSIQLVRELSEASQSRLQELRAHFEAQLSDLRASQHAALEAQRTSHGEERKTWEQRVREREDDYRRLLDDAHRKHEEEARRLKDEIDRVRREERESGEARVRDQKERTEERLRDQKEAHERELRTIRENMETKATAQVAAKEMELATTRDRLSQAKEEAERAKREAEEGKDPVKVMEKAQKTAEALGYSKVDGDPGPKTAGERLAAMLGMGIQNLMSNPQTMDVVAQWIARDKSGAQARPGAPQGAMTGAQAPRQLPTGQTGQVAASPQGQPRRRVDMWGAPGMVRRVETASAPPPTTQAPVASPVAEPVAAPISPGFQMPTPATVATRTDQEAQRSPQEQAPVAPQTTSQETRGPVLPEFDNPFAAILPNEQVVQVLINLERAIDSAVPPDMFAAAILSNFPEQARALVTGYKPEMIETVTRSIPGGSMSSILRQDGKAFVRKVWQAIQAQASARGETS